MPADYSCDHRWLAPPPRASSIRCERCAIRITSTVVAKPQRVRILKLVKRFQPEIFQAIRCVLLRRDN